MTTYDCECGKRFLAMFWLTVHQELACKYRRMLLGTLEQTPEDFA